MRFIMENCSIEEERLVVLNNYYLMIFIMLEQIYTLVGIAYIHWHGGTALVTYLQWIVNTSLALHIDQYNQVWLEPP